MKRKGKAGKYLDPPDLLLLSDDSIWSQRARVAEMGRKELSDLLVTQVAADL